MITGTVKRLAGELADSRAFGPVLRRIESRKRTTGFLRVLAYHRIDVAGHQLDIYPGLISTSPESFAAQMEFIANNYRVVSLEEVLAATRGEFTLPADSVQLTFDDATVDFAIHAWPVLKRLGLPATVFVPTAYPDNPSLHFWWDRLYRAVMRSTDGTTIPAAENAVTLNQSQQRIRVFRDLKEHLKRIPNQEFQQLLHAIECAAQVPAPQDNNVMGWDQLRQLLRDGVDLAPHTHTHPMLNQLPPEQLRDELETSVSVLSQKLNVQAPKAVAYPAGGVDDTVVSTMTSLGFDVGYTTERGLNAGVTNRYRLKRINVGARTTLGLLRLQLANWGK